MEELVIDMGYDRYRADQILLPLYYKFPKDIVDIPQLPKKLREELTEAGYTIGSAKEIHRVVSDDGDTTKLLLNLSDESSVETVLMQYPSKKNWWTSKINNLCFNSNWMCYGLCILCNRTNGI